MIELNTVAVMERMMLRVEARKHINEVGQDSGWALSVTDDTGNLIDDFVVHRREVAALGDEVAIHTALAQRYDVSNATLVRGTELDDDGQEHPIVHVEGVRSR